MKEFKKKKKVQQKAPNSGDSFIWNLLIQEKKKKARFIPLVPFY